MLRFLISPIASFCVRRSIRLPEVLDMFKRCLVDAARHQLEAEGTAPTAAKISVLTGVHRKDIRLFIEESPSRSDPLQKHPLVRLLSFWTTDPEFFDNERGAPRLLPEGDKFGSVGALVRRVTGDANPYSLLYTLERSGLVRRGKDGSFELIKYAFSVTGEEGWEMLVELVSDAIECLEHNVTTPADDRNLHLKTVFDNVPARFAPLLRKELRERGKKFQGEIRSLLSQYDRDMNPSLREVADDTVEISCSTFGLVRHG